MAKNTESPAAQKKNGYCWKTLNHAWLLLCVCGICRSLETMDLRRNSYSSAVDGDAASIMSVQAYRGMAVSINRCKDALPRCRCVFFPSGMLLAVRKASLSPLHPSKSLKRRWAPPLVPSRHFPVPCREVSSESSHPAYGAHVQASFVGEEHIGCG